MIVALTKVPDKQEVFLFTDAIAGVFNMPAIKAVGVIVIGGGTIPVEGTVPQILDIIKAAKSAALNPIQEEKPNGIPKRKKQRA